MTIQELEAKHKEWVGKMESQLIKLGLQFGSSYYDGGRGYVDETDEDKSCIQICVPHIYRLSTNMKTVDDFKMTVKYISPRSCRRRSTEELGIAHTVEEALWVLSSKGNLSRVEKNLPEGVKMPELVEPTVGDKSLNEGFQIGERYKKWKKEIEDTLPDLGLVFNGWSSDGSTFTEDGNHNVYTLLSIIIPGSHKMLPGMKSMDDFRMIVTVVTGRDPKMKGALNGDYIRNSGTVHTIEELMSFLHEESPIICQVVRDNAIRTSEAKKKE